jgi:hypothetical protein
MSSQDKNRRKKERIKGPSQTSAVHAGKLAPNPKSGASA